jgi:hypothetical protein
LTPTSRPAPVRAVRIAAYMFLACGLVASVPAPVSAEWTLGVFIGVCRTPDTSLTLRQADRSTEVTLDPVHYDSGSFDSPLYYGYRVGFFPRARWFGVEGEYIHLKVFADTSRPTHVTGTLDGRPIDETRPFGSVIERFSISHGVNALFVNAVFRRQAAASAPTPARWSITGRVGAGPSIPHPESTIGGIDFEHYEWGALALQAAGGAEVHVAGPLSVMGEYKLTRTKQDVTVAGGSAQTTLVTHHLAFGVVAHLP